jgi:ABC-type lipoprotein release transport system permease subunit
MLALAWRNIWRKRWRSLFTVGAVAVVVLLTVINFGLVGAVENGIYGRLTQESGHLQVRVANYRELRSFSDLLIREATTVQERLEAALERAQITVILEVPGLLESEGRSRGILLVGGERAAAARERFIDAHLLAGALPGAGDFESIALGQRLAEALKVELGDTVYLYAPGTEGFGAAAYTVVGLLGVGAGPQSAYVSLEAAQEVAAPDAVSRFEITFPELRRKADDEALPVLKEQVEAVLGPGHAVETWREVNPAMAGYLDSAGPITTVSNAIFFILAGLLVLNTVYLSIIERVREFGVIMALGAKRAKAIGMVFSESLLLCGSGALVGAGLGLGLVAYLAQGFSFPAPLAELYAEAGIPTVLYASITAGQLIVTALFAFFTGVLAALIPAFTAGRLEPVEAMRFAA